jgi:hypothetical protein
MREAAPSGDRAVRKLSPPDRIGSLTPAGAFVLMVLGELL